MSENYGKEESFVERYGKDFLAGTIAGMAQTVAGQPFDTVKVRLQVSSHSKFKGPLDCLVKTVKGEGFFGLYKGMSTPLAFAGMFTAVELATWGYFKKVLFSVKGLKEGEVLSIGDTIIAGMLTGLVTPFIYTPTEIIKINLQAQEGKKLFDGPFDALKKIVRRYGVRGMFRGNVSCMMREVPANFGYFGTYETLKRILPKEHPQASLPLSYTIFAGSCAGVMNWLVSLPQDVIKSRLALNDDNFNTFSKVFKDILHKEGLPGFFRGLSPALLRAIPASGITFFVYESVTRYLD